MESSIASTPPVASTASPAPKHKPRNANAYFWLRPNPPGSFKFPAFLRRLGLQQPDCRRNPAFWVTRTVYGGGILERSLELVARAKSILLVGDTMPWLCWEVARRNPKARVLALDSNLKAVEWAKQHFRDRWPSQLDIVTISNDFKLVCEPAEEQSFDLVLWNFVTDATAAAEKGPGRQDLLQAALQQLAPSGQVVYYEATEPSVLNLERWSRWRHFWARLGGQMSDPWNQRRAVENRYREDALRRHQKVSLEAGLFQTLQAALQIQHHRRTRPVVDTLLSSAMRIWFTFWYILLWDRLALRLGWLDGSCRFAILEKKSS